MTSHLKSMLDKPWVWSFLAAAAAWLFGVFWAEGRGAVDLVLIAFSFGALTSMVSFGQMLVITSGPGHIDLSIPSVIVMSSAISMVIMGEQNSQIALGLAVAIGASAIVGALNHALIRYLAIPPIIATLANGLIVMSVAIVVGRGTKIKPPSLVADFVNYRLPGGFPLLGLVAIVTGVIIYLVLQRTRYGRGVAAIGQSERAASFSGVRIQRVRLITYIISAVMAGLTGVLIAGLAGGNSLDQGKEYLLLTVAVVVIGGTVVTGGRASVAGIIGASLFMFLLVAMLNTTGANAGLRLLLTGLIIMGVIAAVGRGRQR